MTVPFRIVHHKGYFTNLNTSTLASDQNMKGHSPEFIDSYITMHWTLWNSKGSHPNPTGRKKTHDWSAWCYEISQCEDDSWTIFAVFVCK